MSATLPNGSIISIASGYATTLALTALSNASAAIGTTAAHTYTIGDFLEVSSGWSRLNNKIVRLSAATTPSITMEGMDTTSTSAYPAGGGVGSVRKITGWTQLAQILNSSSSGGDQEFHEYQFLEADRKNRIPTVKSAAGLELSIADDPTLAGYILVAAANDDRLQRAVKVTLPNGGIILYNALISLDKTPSLTVNEIMAVKATLSFQADVVRY